MFQNPILKSSVAHGIQKKRTIMFSLKAVEEFPKKKILLTKNYRKEIMQGARKRWKNYSTFYYPVFFYFFVYVKEILAQVFTR